MRRVRWLMPTFALAAMVLAPGGFSAGESTGGTTTRVSVDSSGTQMGGYNPAVSDDGTLVAFIYGWQVYVHDRTTGQTVNASVDNQGNPANLPTYDIDISGDGRFVAFDSLADNLVPDDTNDGWDIFVHDRITGETVRASLSSEGTEATTGRPQNNPALSEDGRYVAWATSNVGLVPGDLTSGGYDILVRDLLTGTTTRASVDSEGVEGNGNSLSADLSADGRFVTFYSRSTNLVSDDNGAGLSDVFVHDRQTGETTRVSDGNIDPVGNGDSYFPEISADGRYVAFESWSSNLVVGDTNSSRDVFVYDRQLAATTRISVSSGGTEGDASSRNGDISSDGRYVVFRSEATNLVQGDTNGVDDIFVHDRVTGQTTRVSVDSEGVEGNGVSRQAEVSAGGTVIAFRSDSTNLVANDTNSARDVFVHERHDDDLDGVLEPPDNCPATPNAGQSDIDLDDIGDACDTEGPSPNSAGLGGADDCSDGFDNDGDTRVDGAQPACDGDGDGVEDINDNCPATANAGQEDVGGDPVGDACDNGNFDDDQFTDATEYHCSSDPGNPASVPERVDLGGDEDGDGQADEALPPGAVAFDCDGDGYLGATEAHVFGGQTDRDQDPCGADGWPSELNSSTFPINSLNRVDIMDMISFLAPVKYFGTDVGTNPGDVRWDLSPGPGIFPTDINITDLTALIAGPTAYPPMLGGAQALGGPVCPWAP